MDLFIHQENQKILWTLIQKHPLYPYLLKTLSTTTPPISGETWFRNNIEELYDMFYPNYKDSLYLRHSSDPKSFFPGVEINEDAVEDVLKLNKYTLSHLVMKLKKNMNTATTNTSTTTSSNTTPMNQTGFMGLGGGLGTDIGNNVSGNLLFSNESMTSLPNTSLSQPMMMLQQDSIQSANINELDMGRSMFGSVQSISEKQEFVLPSYESPDVYNPVQIKKEREERTIKEFKELKEKYDELHMKPVPMQLNLTTIVEKSGENITELAKIQEEMRKLDSQYISPPTDSEPFNRKLSRAFTSKYAEN
jgi:hypothetical protein